VLPALPSRGTLLAAAAALPRLSVPPDVPGGPLLVGVSGGADSVYLLLALLGDPALGGRVTAVHFDHRARGAESAVDAAFVSALCAALGVACRLGSRPAEGPASEGALRLARDAFFSAVRTELGATIVVTAHHVDDVQETLLLRLARGAGPGGLGSLRATRRFRDGHVRWRPLVAAGLRKHDLESALRSAGVPWREDATNALPVAARNRVRTWLGAGAEEALGPAHASGFALSSSLLAGCHDALLAWAAELGCSPGAAELDVRALRGRPAALCHVALAEHFRALTGTDPSSQSLLPLAEAVREGRDGRFMLLGRLYRIRGGCLVCAEGPPPLGSRVRTLALGVPDAECGLLLESVDVDPALWSDLAAGRISNASVAYLSPGFEGLAWRGRAEGDRYRPLGAAGVSKLSDLFINRKIPEESRDALPVVLDRDEIVWVPGLPPAESRRLAGPCKGALRLTCPPPGVVWNVR